MAIERLLRDGTSAEVALFTPVESELIYNKTTKRLHNGDATTQGGIPVPNYLDVLKQSFSTCAVTGTADNILLEPIHDLLAYSVGVSLDFKASSNNTGAVTVDVNGLGVKSVKVMVNGTKEELSSDTIVNGGMYKILFDGGDFQLSGAGGFNLSTQGIEVFDTVGVTTWTNLGVKKIKVTAIGGGGGGGIRVYSGTYGGNGGATSFGDHVTAGGGQGGRENYFQASGGLPSGDDYGIRGAKGKSIISDNSTIFLSGAGADSPLGGGAGEGFNIGDGVANGRNASDYGAGGGGRFVPSQIANSGSGGAAGALAVKVLDVSGISTIDVTVGARGNRGVDVTVYGGYGFQGICIIENLG